MRREQVYEILRDIYLFFALVIFFGLREQFLAAQTDWILRGELIFVVFFTSRGTLSRKEIEWFQLLVLFLVKQQFIKVTFIKRSRNLIYITPTSLKLLIFGTFCLRLHSETQKMEKKVT